MRGMKKEEPFFECLNLFERQEKPPQVTAKCKSAIQAGLELIDEAIVHGLLMSTYAKQKDLEKAQEELLHAREAVGKIIGLSGQELQMFIYTDELKDPECLDIYKDSYEENLPKSLMLDSLLFISIYAIGPYWYPTNQKQRKDLLEYFSTFPDVSELYMLLGDLWATRSVDYAIECLKIVERNESHRPAPNIMMLACEYKLGKLYREKGEVTLAIKEFKKVLPAFSHPGRRFFGDDGKEVGYYWIAKAKKDLADIEQ